MKTAFLFVVAVLLGLWRSANAQITPPTQKPINSVIFQQQLEVFDWRYLIGYGGRSEKSTYTFGVDVTTSMTERNDGNRWKDNQIGFLNFSWILGKTSTLLARLQMSNFHDELSAFNFDRKQAAATVAGRWQPSKNVRLQPEVGYRWEIRPDFEERGPYGAISFSADDFELNEYRNNASGLAEITRFPERKNANARINYSVSRKFQAGTWDSLSVFYDFFRRDNFFSNPTQGNIESLRKEQRGLANLLQYRLNKNMALGQRTTITLGKVSVQQFDQFRQGAKRAHDDYSFSNNINLSWTGNKFYGAIDLEAAESTVKYNIPDSAGFSPFSRRFATIGYDLSEKKTKFAQATHYRPNDKNLFRLMFELEKLQHDNTDTTNNDSYDEQRWQFSLMHTYQISEALSLGWRLSAFLKHFVYIDGKLSSQNNWARLLQLQPVVKFTPVDNMLFQHRVGVQTQYVNFDFEGDFSQARSYVIRDFYMSDSLAFPVSQQIGLSLYYR
ncbi:MAG: hypothetical protein ACE5I1_19270, partial [bacterium]